MEDIENNRTLVN